MTPQQLKDSILKLAVEGKLVPQIPSEGNAEDLYKQIQKEKQQLIKEGKIKKEKSLDPIPEDEIPFDIPQNWKWVKLGNLASVITKGSSPSWQGFTYTDKENGIPFITSENVGCNVLLLEKKKYVSKGFNEAHKSSILKYGDILTNIVGASIGRTAVFEEDNDDANINQAVCLIRLINPAITSYLLKYMLSPVSIKSMLINTVDTARANLSLTSVSNLLVPLPPLAEQRRIVKKIEELLPMVDKYGDAYNQLTELENQFPKDLKKSVLQYAMEGKLVPQIESEGNAEDLYKQIQKEKAELIKKGVIKKEKPLDLITEDEIPFDIPQSWKWVRTSFICQLLDGEKKDNCPYPYLEARYLRGKDNPTILNSGKFITKGTKIILVDGENSGEVFDVQEDGYMGSTFKVLNYVSSINEKYLLLFLLYHKEEYRNNKKGSAIPHLNKDLFFNTLLPIPPLAEQKRIVDKIEELFSIIDKKQQSSAE